MEKTIKVMKAPPGFLDKNIRQSWVGVTMLFLTLEQVREKWAGTKWENPGPELSGPEHVFVEMSVAIAALRAAGKEEAADKWQTISQADQRPYRAFSRVVCLVSDEMIEEGG